MEWPLEFGANENQVPIFPKFPSKSLPMGPMLTWELLDPNPAQTLFLTRVNAKKTYCYMSFYPFRRPMIYGAHFQIMLAYPEGFFYAPKLPVTGKHIRGIFIRICDNSVKPVPSG